MKPERCPHPLTAEISQDQPGVFACSSGAAPLEIEEFCEEE
jgi:hypothetical protein